MSDNGTAGELRPQQRRAVELLLAGKSAVAVCKELKLGRSSLYRWFQEPGFKLALADGEAAALAELSRGLVFLARASLATIAGILQDTSLSPAVRLRAAEIVLMNLLRLRELSTIEGSLGELERMVADESRGQETD